VRVDITGDSDRGVNSGESACAVASSSVPETLCHGVSLCGDTVGEDDRGIDADDRCGASKGILLP